MRNLIACLILLISSVAAAQHSFNVSVRDSATNDPLPGVAISIEGKAGGVSTAVDGTAHLTSVPAGTHTFFFSFVGYRDKLLTLTFPLQDSTRVYVVLLSQKGEMLEEVTVTSTRTNSRMEDLPTRVEVMGAEDVEEENTIKPGNVTSLLGDISTIQLQPVSAASGGTEVKMMGLPGRYTQLLRDGLPVYSGFSSSFGVLQLPPLDLKQIEIIKGAASTLYGGGAIAGLINFVSKEPGEQREASFTLNQSTLLESNVNAYYARKKNKAGITFFASGTNQEAADVDNDDFSDVPFIQTLVLHPRIFIYFRPRTKLTVGWSGTFEDREGGDMLVLRSKADSVHQYFEKNYSARNIGELFFETPAGNSGTFTVKGSFSNFYRSIHTNGFSLAGVQQTGYGEAAYLYKKDKNDLVAGVNVISDSFTQSKPDSFYFPNTYDLTLGAFVQDDWRINEKLTLEAGLRADHHNTFGTFVLPRVSMLYRPWKEISFRLGAGQGYKTPSLFSGDAEQAGFSNVVPFIYSLKAEKATGANLDVNYKKYVDEAIIYISQSFFYTQVDHPVLLVPDSTGLFYFSNMSRPLTTAGSDTYARISIDELEIYLGYTYTNTVRKYNEQYGHMPLTPRHKASTTVAYEIEGKWRFGIEASWIGRQYLENNSTVRGYPIMAAMIEKKFKHFNIVLNGENLLDARQSRYERVVLPPVAAPSFRPLWAPLDGRVINLAARISL